jgi:N-acetylneuraminic acid mutarotase
MMADLPGVPGVILLGGADTEGPPNLLDMWRFVPGHGWRDITPTELPTFPSDPSLAGVIGNAFEFDLGSRLAVFADIEGGTWIYDAAANSWEQVRTEPGPTELLGTSLAYDVGSDRLIAFGGYSFGGGPNDETWSYDLDGSAWERMSPRRSPSPRNFYQAAYDPASDRVILFGGADDFAAFADTWAFDVDADAWTKLSPERSPPARTYGWMVYDSVGRRMILFGGTDYPAEEPMSDTWAFDPATETWTELDAPGPSARGWHAMAYDAETETIVLLGGGPSRVEYTAETWLFDVRTDTWTQVS